MNRRGKDVVMFFPFALLMVIIGVGIIAGVILFYAQKLDVRATEAELLLDSVKQCAETRDFFAADFTLEECGINLGQSSNHLVYLKRSDGQEAFSGVRDFTDQCLLEGIKGRSNAPLCINTTIQTPQGEYYILVASNQQARRGAA